MFRAARRSGSVSALGDCVSKAAEWHRLFLAPTFHFRETVQGVTHCFDGMPGQVVGVTGADRFQRQRVQNLPGLAAIERAYRGGDSFLKNSSVEFARFAESDHRHAFGPDPGYRGEDRAAARCAGEVSGFHQRNQMPFARRIDVGCTSAKLVTCVDADDDAINGSS